MRIRITKSARRFGYLIWNGRLDEDIKRLVEGNNEFEVSINNISLGTKRVDWGYHRIYIGTKITQGLASDQIYCQLVFRNGRLDIATDGGC
ncbi:hypothetical protein [Adlercreutzia sp. ZJ242]|uniref:hypothetical protein n=1 Tax=Adlercreutzia sp. ZJ242 TaxID=2709409 RepID=UPI0013ED78D0|nr:hypothetical protein [Adlercreutzia sp. ZJ242]